MPGALRISGRSPCAAARRSRSRPSRMAASSGRPSPTMARRSFFERDFGIWKLDVASGKASPIELVRRGAPSAPEVTHLTLNNGFRGLALSPDGRKVSFLAHGEVFAAGAREGGQAARVTRTAGNESEIAWSPDSRKMAYVSDRDGKNQIYTYDFQTTQET